ncbi:MAG TPA: hypothetical protein VEW26_09890 [Allosphingosinicella sp.]|nr:hypothetical protein [Allosphingosinicella sp.]
MNPAAPRSAVILCVAAAMLGGGAPPPSQRQADVERAIFEYCPKLIAGTMSLEDPATLTAIGYVATERRKIEGGSDPRAVRGTGTGQTVLSAGGAEKGGTCAVWFGETDAKRLVTLFGQVRSRAKAEKFKGGRMLKLGDGTPMFLYERGGAKPVTLVFFVADAGGELDYSPAMTAVMMAKGK